jgi:hypothetical protein
MNTLQNPPEMGPDDVHIGSAALDFQYESIVYIDVACLHKDFTPVQTKLGDIFLNTGFVGDVKLSYFRYKTGSVGKTFEIHHPADDTTWYRLRIFKWALEHRVNPLLLDETIAGLLLCPRVMPKMIFKGKR